MLCRQWWVLITSWLGRRSTCSYAWGFVDTHRLLGDGGVNVPAT